jgi:predicted transcriptional regulator
MTTIHAEIPDSLARQLAELAQQEKTSVDNIISIALASQISNWRKGDTVAERAKRGSWEKFEKVMAKVRAVPPLPGDEIK